MNGSSWTRPGGSPRIASGIAQPPARGVSFVAPTGWQVTEIQEGHVLDCLLRPEPAVSHMGRIVVFKADSGNPSMSSAFGAAWPRMLAILRDQGLSVSDPGDVIAYYWGRLDAGIPVYWMGRFYYDPDPRKSVYAALYTLGLPGATQSIFATVTPLGGSPSLAMNLATSARLTLLDSLRQLFLSINGPAATRPVPLFLAADVVGEWSEAVGTPGAHVWNSVFGAYAGQSGTGHRVTYRFDASGAYDHQFTVMHSSWGSPMPSHSQQGHRGTWNIDGDLINLEPSPPNGRDNRIAVVGAGWRNAGGAKHRLLLLSPSPGEINLPNLAPDGAELEVSGKSVAWCEEVGR